MSRQGFIGWCCDIVFFCRGPHTRLVPTIARTARVTARKPGGLRRTTERLGHSIERASACTTNLNSATEGLYRDKLVQ